jgi:hypothetical protein
MSSIKWKIFQNQNINFQYGRLYGQKRNSGNGNNLRLQRYSSLFLVEMIFAHPVELKGFLLFVNLSETKITKN